MIRKSRRAALLGLAGGGATLALGSGIVGEKLPAEAAAVTAISAITDLEIQASPPLIALTYRRPQDALKGVTVDGAAGANALWEQGSSGKWFIEEQRGGEIAAIGGLLSFDEATLAGALRLFDWGFARQHADGSFSGSADLFHSTSFFLAAVAHSCLLLRAAASNRYPLALRYLPLFERYTAKAGQAAQWMTQPAIWSAGLAGNAPFTHRRYLVGAALGLTSVLTADATLLGPAHRVLEDGLARQQPDGVNPERGGYDSSYQMTGVVFAEHWIAHFPNDPLTPRVRAMVQRALTWESTQVLTSGEVSALGNTRTAGQERGRTGVVKGVSYARVIRGFGQWAALTGDPRWAELAWRTGRYYFATPGLAARPLLP